MARDDSRTLLWRVVQGMLGAHQATTTELVDQGSEYMHRYRALQEAVCDYADLQDSRQVRADLYRLVCDVTNTPLGDLEVPNDA